MINRIKGRFFNRKGARFSFAQAGEDLVLQRIFLGVENGFYVDVGAYHPFRLSNTYSFYVKGWVGINVEPRPGSKKLFDSVRPNDINLELGVAEESGVAKYYSFKEDTLNRFNGNSVSTDAPDERDIEEEHEIKVEPLWKIFDEHLKSKRYIDFITIDTEGSEYEVLKSNDWGRFPIRVVLVEDNKRVQTFGAVTDFLESKGYSEAYRIPVNIGADSVFFMMR